MIPQNSLANIPTEISCQPGKTYALRVDEERLMGHVDGLKAVEQAVYLILNTERYRYPIYSWNYGVELEELFGKPISWVLPEIKRRISEAIKQDDRVKDVTDFSFKTSREKVICRFLVKTIYGNINLQKEVNV